MEPHDRKTARKQNRCTKYINKETGITFPGEPRKALLIGNAGLVSGLQREQVLELFVPFGPVDNVIMLPGKSYCFVQFHDVSSSEKAYNQLHGKSTLPSSHGPMYLAYANEVPDCPDEWCTPPPPGLVILPDFITEEEERLLLSVFERFRQDEDSEGTLKHRDVQHFGYEFRYGSNDVDPKCPLDVGIPSECDIIWSNLREHGMDIQPDQLTVNYYKPGQGIPRHVDTHSPFEEPIISLSLNSDIVMDWHSTDNTSVPLLLRRRTLLIMTGEARYGWTHGIVPRKSDIIPSVGQGLTVAPRGYRVSLTFRKIRQERFCSCIFPKLCDYQQDQSNKNATPSAVCSLNNEEASKLEASHVHEVYEKIGAHFSDTRSKPWPNVLNFVLSLPSGSILLDVGCGNGKYFGKREQSAPKVFELGCDMSSSLANVCISRGFEVTLNNCLALPLRSNIADACVSIAVIHHLSNEERRKQAISEMIRVLRPGGRALVYVWARDQERHTKKSSYLRQDRKNRRENDSEASNSVQEELSAHLESSVANLALPVHTNRTQFKHSDVLVPWKLKHKSAETVCSNVEGDKSEPPTFLRFYHVFDEGEIEKLCSSVEGAHVEHSYYDQGNWCVIFAKVS